jgi:RNA polymerase sigma-70 factor (ECF subfamily)
MITEELILQFQQKNVKAFDKLYHYYNDSLFGVINNIVGDQDLAKDILQEVFIKIWNNSNKYNKEKGRFFTWILNIARNSAIDTTRSKNFKKSLKNQDVENFVDIIENNENFESKSNFIGVKKFVQQLTDKCKSIIELLFFKGFTQKETAEKLKIPLGTVKTRNRNCINELRKMMN